jgi:hypothetical protein
MTVNRKKLITPHKEKIRTIEFETNIQPHAMEQPTNQYQNARMRNMASLADSI